MFEGSENRTNNPNILLLVAGGWISFMNQGRGLQSALAKIGIDAELILAGSKPSDLTHTPDLTKYRDYIVVVVGSWQDYGRLIAPAQAAGCKVLPWLVSDDKVDAEIVNKLNTEFPWFLTTSEYCRNIFIRYGVQPEKVHVLYEAIDEDIWKPTTPEQANEFLDYLSIDEGNQIAMPVSFNIRKAKAEHTPILLTIGGDATSKGAMEIISALHKLDHNTPWIWIIKTLPYEYSFGCSIEQYSALAELAPRVKFIIGEFSAKFLVQLMNTCDIYIATSRGEGFGLPLAEAQMCGKMVITHDSTSTREIIIKDKTGLLSDSQESMSDDGRDIIRADIDSLASQLQSALTNPELRKTLSDQSRDIAVGRFGKQVIAEKLIEYIKEYTK
ncbi:hypothetical protein COV88_03365 [Candidatus Saccharibacteria bacterium CG11_big_fil_rev_8_21_14_0_20_41_19]|nr:glycosyltransferase family 4 protein [Candidatus Saccharibacteria bacterium]OIP86109.1 MAG: hypothetical protein AUK57_01395 [Candidatus Saccharibacteria bacterium CG2_30_41_52]PIQ70634.1 MAG: hypothetical protein COV88_03365 [Candidatus Saccharibacteria bacterium CG11_big_fil_rev_8_21_14_0_20_41_19]PIZ60547.1 MAG: hypothetical protein COY18_01060 [Candidatus Saccharibacteria bacterium CG_4_10_14_0_2_um_filter_41_11]PJC29530.1 MAG: hypothetical protein CO052_02895 [Candidatus Saccharibacteri